MSDSGDYGIALALAAGAGMSTAIGAMMPFFRFATSRMFLGGSMAFAAGVMSYVSFVELVPESIHSFELRLGDERAQLGILWGTICFFGGVLLTILFDIIVHRIEHAAEVAEGAAAGSDSDDDDSTKKDIEDTHHHHGNAVVYPVTSTAINADAGMTSTAALAASDPTRHISFCSDPIGWIRADWAGRDLGSEDTPQGRARLRRAGILSTLAVALHNLPEGLATFIGYVFDPSVGIALAVAVAIHNIPEGICVAMPIYHATGSRLRGFVYGVLSGVSEVVGALIGFAMVNSLPNTDLLYGIMFGAVAGMMVYISFKELLPMAHRYDQAGHTVTAALFAGMLVMALSLVLFAL